MQKQPTPNTEPEGIRRIAPLLAPAPTEGSQYGATDLADRIRALSPLARVEGVKLAVRVTDPADDSRYGSRDRVFQLTTSLVSLAIRYSRGGAVSLHVDASPDQTLRLFLTFSNIDEASRNQHLLWAGGAAAQLTLQGVVQDFVSLGADVGLTAGLRDRTEIYVTLPKAPPPTQPQDLAGRHFLLVGEHAPTLDAVAEALVSRGANVTRRGQTGQTSAASCDAIIVDVDTVEDEAATLFKVRETARLQAQRQAPALALVGTASREDIERYFCMGFDTLAFKPLCHDEICQKLRTVI